MKKLYIYGAGFLDVIKLIDAINRNKPTWSIEGFIDDAVELQHKSISGYPVLGGQEILSELSKARDAYFFNNVTTASRSMKIAEILNSHKCKIANLIHPSVDMNYVEIGQGCIIQEGCCIGGRVKLGSFIKMRLNAVVSHDAVVEDYVVIGPGAVAGSNTLIREGALIGAGSTVMLRREVGKYSTVGAGAVVTANVPDEAIVAGVPAKELKKHR